MNWYKIYKFASNNPFSQGQEGYDEGLSNPYNGSYDEENIDEHNNFIEWEEGYRNREYARKFPIEEREPINENNPYEPTGYRFIDNISNTIYIIYHIEGIGKKEKQTLAIINKIRQLIKNENYQNIYPLLNEYGVVE